MSCNDCSSGSATEVSCLCLLDNYGFSTRFGWVGDRFGVTWQLNLQ